MNLGELRAYAKGQYALPEAVDDARLTDAQWNRYLNRSYAWLAMKARLFGETWATIPMVAGTREYSLASLSPALAGIRRVAFKRGGTDGSWTALPSLPDEQITRLVTDWHDGTGTPSHYYLNGLSIGVHPTPDADNAGAFLKVYGWALPTRLSDDTATGPTGTPQIPVHLHDLLIPGACYEAAKQEAMDGRGDAALLLQMWDRERQQALAELLEYMAGLDTSARFVDASYDYDLVGEY